MSKRLELRPRGEVVDVRERVDRLAVRAPDDEVRLPVDDRVLRVAPADLARELERPVAVDPAVAPGAVALARDRLDAPRRRERRGRSDASHGLVAGGGLGRRHDAPRHAHADHCGGGPGYTAASVAAVAQLARASACHAEGRGFESLQPLLTEPPVPTGVIRPTRRAPRMRASTRARTHNRRTAGSAAAAVVPLGPAWAGARRTPMWKALNRSRTANSARGGRPPRRRGRGGGARRALRVPRDARERARVARGLPHAPLGGAQPTSFAASSTTRERCSAAAARAASASPPAIASAIAPCSRSVFSCVAR